MMMTVLMFSDEKEYDDNFDEDDDNDKQTVGTHRRKGKCHLPAISSSLYCSCSRAL